MDVEPTGRDQCHRVGGRVENRADDRDVSDTGAGEVPLLVGNDHAVVVRIVGLGRINVSVACQLELRLLVVDAVTGQNGLSQAREFMKAADITGLVLTKLDGTAKGGIAVAIAKELNLPIRYCGIGEKADDLVVFDPKVYVEGLFE